MVIDAMDRARALGVDLVAFPELVHHRVPAGGPPVQARVHRGEPARARPVAARASRGSPWCVGFVDRRDDIFNAAAVLHDGARRGHLPQAVPAELRRVRREPLFPGRRRDARCSRSATSLFAVNICEDIWYPTGPTDASGAGRRRADRHDQQPRRTTPARRASARRCWPHAPPTTSCAWPSSTWSAARTSWCSTAQSLVFNERGERLAREAARSRRTWSSPTSTSTTCSARACATRGGERKSSPPRRRCRRSPSRPGAAAARRRRCAPAPRRGGSGGSTRSIARSCVGTRDYVRKNGFSRVVIGLSGGIDSALVAARSPWMRWARTT